MPPSKNISFEELSQYFHLPINAVAKELGVCATILKKTCRKNGIPRWPHRKIKSIDNRIANLQVNLEKNPQDRDEIAKEIELLKCKKQEIMRNPDILVKASKSSDDASPISEPPTTKQATSTHQPIKQSTSISQSRSAPYAVKTFKVVKEESSDADDSPSNSQTTAPTSTQTTSQQQSNPARSNESANHYPMNPYFNSQALYREMMEEPMMSGLNFMSNPASNRLTEQANQLALERIMKNHNTKMSNPYMNSHNGTRSRNWNSNSVEYEMPPSQNPYIASPSSLFNDGPASYIQPPATLYNYGTYSSSSSTSASWSQSQPPQQQQQAPMRGPYPPYNPSSINALYQQMLNHRDTYFPPLDLPPQQPPRQTENPNGSEKLSLSEYVTLARASALFANREDILNHNRSAYQQPQQQQQQPPSYGPSASSMPLNM